MSLLSRFMLVLVVAALVVAPEATAWAKSDDDDIEIDDIGRVKQGKEHVRVRVDVHESGRTCSLKVKYADGNADSPDDVTSNKNGICLIYFDVPDRSSVVGVAIAKVTVTEGREDRGKSARIFTVRGGRK
jgi:hypothetical protein